MNSLDLAYCAGLIDGEGHIGISRTGRPKKHLLPGYSLTIEVSMVDRDCVDRLACILGGRVYEGKTKTRGNRSVFSWYLLNQKAIDALVLIQPYLILKKKHADAVIATPPTIMPRGSFIKRPQSVVDNWVFLKEKLSSMNYVKEHQASNGAGK